MNRAVVVALLNASSQSQAASQSGKFLDRFFLIISNKCW